MKYSKNKSVSFDPFTHTYLKKDKKLISVTTLISKFKNEFDSDFWSKKIALRENTTQEIILAKWKEKAFKSTEIGTAIHKIFEDYTNGIYCFENDKLSFDYLPLKSEYLEEFSKKKNVAIQFIYDFFISKRLTPIEAEFIVYNDFLAGQIDNICTDHKGNFYILDFKTNEKIETYSYGKKMKHLFSDMNDSSYYHYCLQLSIYKKMLKEYKINKIFLVHIKSDSYEFLECQDLMKNIDINELKIFAE